MSENLEDLLSSYCGIDFGTINITTEEKSFCLELSNEIVGLCRSLPEPVQIDAFFFLMKYLATPFGQPFNFFKNYYAPAWSIIYWLIQFASERNTLKPKDKQHSKLAHSMALFLHPFDDHLNDNELPATHLTLLLRSQAWMLMHKALNCLAARSKGKKAVVQRYIEDYYCSVTRPKRFLSLDGYCEFFRKQMATWFIVPTLITKNMAVGEDLSSAVQTAYGSFGISWRLLDDIQDIKADMIKGMHSAIYTILPEKIKYHWDKEAEDKDSRSVRIILEYILENGAIEKIKARICRELESAASIAEAHEITRWADQMRCLMRPL